MAIDKETIEYAAHLARIELKPKELEKLSGQLGDVIKFIDKLNKLDIKGIKPTSHILPINSVFREDVPAESLTSIKALKNAPCQERNFFVVPKVIE